MLSSSLRGLALASLLASLLGTTGCSLIVASTLDGKGKDDAGDDGAADGEAEDGGIIVESCKEPNGDPVADETPCGESAYCVVGVCVPSLCGDSRVVESLGEQCDEGDDKNEDDADGCTILCKFSCDVDDDCETGTTCDGTGTCNEDHVCQTSEPLEDNTPCTPTAGGSGVCMNEVCVPLNCGDGETTGDEECDATDPENGATELNCQPDCTWTCEDDYECGTGDLCAPATCDTAEHLCMPAEPVVCLSSDSCKTSSCDSTTGGCVEAYVDDTDGDGFSGVACDDSSLDEVEGVGGDCDDNVDRNPLQADLCGDDIDNDCNGTIDDGEPTWYLDLDGDSQGTATMSVQQCTQPDGYSPNAQDCQDDAKEYENAADAYVGQKDSFREPFGGECKETGVLRTCWDYNCDGKVTRTYLPLDCSEPFACKASNYGTSPAVPQGYPCGAYVEIYQCELQIGIPLGTTCGPVSAGRTYQTCQ